MQTDSLVPFSFAIRRLSFCGALFLDADLFPESLQLLGMLFGKAGQFQQAALYFTKYLDARPDSPANDEIERYLVEWEALGVIQPLVKQPSSGPQ